MRWQLEHFEYDMNRTQVCKLFGVVYNFLQFTIYQIWKDCLRNENSWNFVKLPRLFWAGKFEFMNGSIDQCRLWIVPWIGEVGRLDVWMLDNGLYQRTKSTCIQDGFGIFSDNLQHWLLYFLQFLNLLDWCWSTYPDFARKEFYAHSTDIT